MPGTIRTANEHTPTNNPRFDQFTEHLLARVDASLEKAERNLTDAANHPIRVGAESLERTLVSGVQDLLSPEQLNRLKQRARTRPKATGVAASANLRSETPVEEQIGFLPPGVENRRRWIDEVFGGRETPAPGGGVPVQAKRLELRAHGLKCLKETGEWGKDEIDLTGQASVVEKTGTNDAKMVYDKQIASFRVGSFHTNDAVNLNQRVLIAFPIDIGAFPKGFMATLLAVEKDHGDASKIRKVVADIKKVIESDLVKALKEIDLGSIDKLVDTIIKFAGYIAKAIDKIAAWLGDDLFDPAPVSLALPAPDASLPGGGLTTAPERVTFVQGKARYELTYDWNFVR